MAIYLRTCPTTKTRALGYLCALPPAGLALLDEHVGQEQAGHPVQALLGLVEDQQPAGPDQDRCQCQSAPLPRGELLWQVPREPSQLQVLQQVTDPLIGLDDTVPEADHSLVLGDGQGGEEGLLPQISGDSGALGT